MFNLFYLEWFWLKEINIILKFPFHVMYLNVDVLRFQVRKPGIAFDVPECGRSSFSSEETWHSFRIKFECRRGRCPSEMVSLYM